jgi:hypothetical protein
MIKLFSKCPQTVVSGMKDEIPEKLVVSGIPLRSIPEITPKT